MLVIAEVFFQMLVGHAVADFALQSSNMGMGKNRHSQMQERRDVFFPPWYYWMTAHALVHGGVVYWISDSIILGVIETILHFTIDFSKCERWISVHQDQVLHILCKIGYCWWIFF